MLVNHIQLHYKHSYTLPIASSIRLQVSWEGQWSVDVVESSHTLELAMGGFPWGASIAAHLGSCTDHRLERW